MMEIVPMSFLSNDKLQKRIFWSRILKYAYNIAFAAMMALLFIRKDGFYLYSAYIFLILSFQYDMQERINGLRLELRTWIKK